MVHESVPDPRDIPLLCKSDQRDRDDPRAVRAAKDFQNVSILRNTNWRMHLSVLGGVMVERPRYAVGQLVASL